MFYPPLFLLLCMLISTHEPTAHSKERLKNTPKKLKIFFHFLFCGSWQIDFK